jgi:hypothetical protein
LQSKIADGTFAIKNSTEAIALQDKPALTRDEQARIISQITTSWDWTTAQNLAVANLAAVTSADKGDVFILAPNDGTARTIAGVFASDPDVRSYAITGQDAAAAITFLKGGTPPATATYNNGRIDVPSQPSQVVTVDRNNVRPALIDSGYYQLGDFEWPTISTTIATSGGVLTSIFDSTTYQFEPGTFTDTVVVSHTMTSAPTSGPGLTGIGHSFDASAVYSGTGQPAQPAAPYKITIQYSDALGVPVKESTLAFYYRDGEGTYQRCGCADEQTHGHPWSFLGLDRNG